MKETISNGIIWNSALRTGLVFGVFSSICLAINQAVEIYWNSPMGIAAVDIVLWILEFAGCIYLMIYFMQRLVADYEGVTQRDTFRYGRRIALCSALIVAGVGLLCILTFSKDTIEAALDQSLSMYSNLLDSNSRAAVDNVKENMPKILFFSQLIRCWLYGVLLSAILSRNIPKTDPFA